MLLEKNPKGVKRKLELAFFGGKVGFNGMATENGNAIKI
jgi:hypothetical protein